MIKRLQAVVGAVCPVGLKHKTLCCVIASNDVMIVLVLVEEKYCILYVYNTAY